MTYLKEFRELGLKITWKLLFIGYKGNPIFSDELTTNQIIEYALDVYSIDATNNLLLELILEERTENVSSLLESLSNIENTCFDIEFRKWRVLFVSKKIAKKNSNYIDGLCELGDIWIKLGYPDDSPFIFQGRNNNISPENYYTKQNYDDLYFKHQVWIADELRFIKNSQ